MFFILTSMSFTTVVSSVFYITKAGVYLSIRFLR